jgi:hypothetical protein
MFGSTDPRSLSGSAEGRRRRLAIAIELHVNKTDIDPERMASLAEDAEVKAEISRPGGLGVYKASIADDLLGAERLEHLLRKARVPVFVRRSRAYSGDELDAAPLFVLRVRTAPRGRGGPSYGSSFDLTDACPTCGTGARLTSELILGGSDIAKKGDVFTTLDDDLVVSQQVREALTEAGVTGLELHEVRAHEGEAVPWWAVTAPHTLPQLSSDSGGLVRESPCQTCGQDGFFETGASPPEFRYDLSDDDLSQVPDVASTWEHFGNSRLAEPFTDSFFAPPRLVVKPLVREVLRELKIRGLELDPIQRTEVGG